MDWFFTDLQKIIEVASRQTEQFLDSATDILSQTMDDVEAHVDHFLEPAITEAEHYLDDFFDPILVDLLGVEQAIEALVSPLTQQIYPVLDQQPACIGCRHYHGKIYGDHLLVCGMHPYGAQQPSCADWES